MAHQHEEGHTCACGGSCGCQSSEQNSNMYLTREEYIERLELYLSDLKAEIASVEAELSKLKTPAVPAHA